jgi:hypothetical protein
MQLGITHLSPAARHACWPPDPGGTGPRRATPHALTTTPDFVAYASGNRLRAYVPDASSSAIPLLWDVPLDRPILSLDFTQIDGSLDWVDAIAGEQPLSGENGGGSWYRLDALSGAIRHSPVDTRRFNFSAPPATPSTEVVATALQPCDSAPCENFIAIATKSPNAVYTFEMPSSGGAPIFKGSRLFDVSEDVVGVTAGPSWVWVATTDHMDSSVYRFNWQMDPGPSTRENSAVAIAVDGGQGSNPAGIEFISVLYSKASGAIVAGYPSDLGSKRTWPLPAGETPVTLRASYVGSSQFTWVAATGTNNAIFRLAVAATKITPFGQLSLFKREPVDFIVMPEHVDEMPDDPDAGGGTPKPKYKPFIHVLSRSAVPCP